MLLSFWFLSFVDGCCFNHLVQFRFSLHTFLKDLVPRIRFLFHSGSPLRQCHQRSLFPLALRLCNFPLIVRALSAFFTGKLLSAGFCLAIPLFVLPSSTLFGHGSLQNRSLLFHCLTVSPAWERSTKTRPTRGAWSLSRKRQQLPVVTIIHQNFHRCHYQLRAKIQVCLPSPIPPSLCSLPHFLCVLYKTEATDANIHVL